MVSQCASTTGLTIHPAALGNTTQNYLGKSQFGDPAFQGTIDDFRIYSRAFQPTEVLLLAISGGCQRCRAAASPVTTASTGLAFWGTTSPLANRL